MERAVLEENPEVQWFEPENYACRKCGKKADGVLRGRTNESFGRHCRKCAEKRIAAAKRVRLTLSRESDD